MGEKGWCISMSVFETLSKIDISNKVEKKGKLTYLSWAWAWAEVKKIYPDANFTIYHNKDGLNYFHDGLTAWVEVGVTIEGQEIIEHLPVMDYRMKSLTLDKVTSFDVNTAIRRCMCKAIALHGLGLHLYIGEDINSLDQKELAKRKTEILKLAQQKNKTHIFRSDGVVNKNGEITPYHQMSEEQWELSFEMLKEMSDA